MKKLITLFVMACGLVTYPYLSFAEYLYTDIVITPSVYTGVFGGFLGGDGKFGHNSIDWGIGNSAPFGTLGDDMVFSTCTGDFEVGDNWKERMRITKDGNVGIGTTSPNEILDVRGSGEVRLQIKSTTAGDAALILDRGDTGESATIEFKTDGTKQFAMGTRSGTSDYFALYASKVKEDVLVVNEYGSVGIGINPINKLHVGGYVRADGFITGDIIFRKDDKPVWRMYEDEKGLYVQSLTTEKKYTLVLEEMSDAGGVSELATNRDKILQLQEDNKTLKEANKALESRLAKIESILNAQQ